MELQQLFYIVGTVALILLSLFLVGLLFAIYRLQKFINFATGKIEFIARNFTDYISSATKTWGKVTVASFVLRSLKRIFIR